MQWWERVEIKINFWITQVLPSWIRIFVGIKSHRYRIRRDRWSDSITPACQRSFHFLFLLHLNVYLEQQSQGLNVSHPSSSLTSCDFRSPLPSCSTLNYISIDIKRFRPRPNAAGRCSSFKTRSLPDRKSNDNIHIGTIFKSRELPVPGKRI